MAYEAFRMRAMTWVLLGLLAILLFVAYVPDYIQEQQRLWQSVGVFVSMLVLVGGMLLLRHMNSRLARMAEMAEAIGGGRYDERIGDRQRDSIGLVGRAVDDMADRIQDAVQRLEAQQQELEEKRVEVSSQNQRMRAEYERQAGFAAFLEELHSVEINSIARAGLHYGMDVANAGLGAFFVREADGDGLKRLYQHGVDRQAVSGMLAGDSSAGLPEEVLSRRAPIILDELDGRGIAPIRTGLGAMPVSTIIGLPVLFREEALGVMVLGLGHRSEEQTLRTLRAVMDALGNALNNARSYQTVQQQALRLRHANEELVEADRLRSEFVANMSHELRTPLNSIIGFSTVLQTNRAGVLQERELGYAEKINRNGKHLLSLINDILDLSKIEAGRMDLDFRPTDLDGVFRETVEMLRPQAQARHISLDLEVAPELPTIDTDSGKLKQVLINLVGNAIKFTEEGGVTVTARAERVAGDSGAIRIEVRDTGIGIPADKMDTVFEPFRQADSGTTRRFGGTGLGLAISRSIAQLLGGELSAESEAGVGSCFIMRLPIGDGGLPDAGKVEGASARGDQASRDVIDPENDERPVLVVDDDADARDLMSTLIHEMDVSVVTAAGGEQALERARSEHPRLITLDLMMEGMDGWEVLSRLKADPELREIPVVIISIVADRRRAMVLGALDALTKPVAESDIQAILRSGPGGELPGRVLVVDDNADARALLREQIGDRAGEIREAENGRQALDMLQDYAPDLVFLDLMMPVMDGIGFLQEMRAMPRFAHTPVVVVSAKVLTSDERTELERRVTDVIEKGDSSLDQRVSRVVADALGVSHEH